MKLKFSFESSVAATAAAAVSARPSLLHWNSGKCGNKKCGKKTKNVAKRKKSGKRRKKVEKEEKISKKKTCGKKNKCGKKKKCDKKKKR